MRTSKIRHQFYLPSDLSAKLDALATKPGASKTSILADALNAWLNRRAANELDQRFGARLDRHSRMLDRIDWNVDLLIETLGVFVQHQMTLVARQPTFDEETAKLGRQRYEALVDIAARRLAKRRESQVLSSHPDDEETRH